MASFECEDLLEIIIYYIVTRIIVINCITCRNLRIEM